MTRWLKAARAETVREILTALRYPMEWITGLVIMYVLFMAFYTGAQMLGGGAALAAGKAALTLNFCLWFFGLLALNVMSMDLESEARQGTLEQVFLSAAHFTGLMWLRGAVHVVLGGGMVLVLALVLQLSTGTRLSLPLAHLLPALGILALTIIGLLGFGLILGGLSLVFKRIGQLSAILQFGLFFVGNTDPTRLAEPWRSLLLHAPLGGGAYLLRHLFAGETETALRGLGWLALDAAVYAAIGTLIFTLLLRTALRQGSLSHY